MRGARIVMLMAVLTALAGAARGQTPAGSEFRVNSYTTGEQLFGRAAAAADGSTIVVWGSHGQDGSGLGVFGQRYDPAGLPRGGEFRVNVAVAGTQWLADVCAARDGAFVVVWESPDEVSTGIYGRRYDAQGTALGPEFRVSTYTIGYQRGPEVACTPEGAFVAAWSSDQEASGAGVFAQRFDASGAPRGGEFQVNSLTTGTQNSPAVAMTPQGGFVIVWNDFQQDGTFTDVVGRRFGPDGAPLGAEFQVNAYTTFSQAMSKVGSIASAADGSFVVAWTGNQTGDGGEVFARVFDASGAPATGDIQVNTYTTGPQNGGSIATDARGNFVVTWRRGPQDNYDVFAQRFRRDGLPRGQQFQVNVYTTSRQDGMSVAGDRAGNFLLLWESMGQDGTVWTQYGRRYGGLLPAALSVDASGNGVLENGESVAVRPAWRNVNGGALTFTGTAASLTGPSGATYTLIDAVATYGTVPNGATQACGGDCYAVSLIAPSRPVLHWDATLSEDILPDALGNSMPWALHVGESFTDVPRTSSFYRFVETALHHGITGGCAGASYCPGSTTTREQMAVFVLVAGAGAGYLPPPCVSPMFGDVPISSPFCPWIHELARRGVVSGCGGGNFCPGAPVSRDQMAVFTLSTKEGPGYVPPACTAPPFADVPVSSPFCRWIQELANRGIVSGCGGGNYCPAAPVLRDQMSVFVTETFGLALYGP